MMVEDIWMIVFNYLENGGLCASVILPNLSDAKIQRLMNDVIYNYLKTRFFPNKSILDDSQSCMDEFVEMLQLSNAVIGGSFIASLLCGNLHDVSDIDIFAPGTNSCILQWFYLQNATTHMNNSNDYESFDALISTFTIANHEYLESLKKDELNKCGLCFIANARGKEIGILPKPQYIINERPIQIIQLRTANVSNYLIQNSDIDLFKTLWDGKSLRFGSLETVENAILSQSKMPSHANFKEVIENFKSKNLNFRFSGTDRSLNRMRKWKCISDRQNWNLQMDETGFVNSLSGIGSWMGCDSLQ